MESTSNESHVSFTLPSDCTSSDNVMRFAAEVREALQELPATVIVDGSEVKRLGSVAIGTLASLQSDLREYGGRLVFRRFSRPARIPFEICRVTEHFVWQDD